MGQRGCVLPFFSNSHTTATPPVSTGEGKTLPPAVTQALNIKILGRYQVVQGVIRVVILEIE